MLQVLIKKAAGKSGGQNMLHGENICLLVVAGKADVGVSFRGVDEIVVGLFGIGNVVLVVDFVAGSAGHDAVGQGVVDFQSLGVVSEPAGRGPDPAVGGGNGGIVKADRMVVAQVALAVGNGNIPEVIPGLYHAAIDAVVLVNRDNAVMAAHAETARPDERIGDGSIQGGALVLGEGYRFIQGVRPERIVIQYVAFDCVVRRMAVRAYPLVGVAIGNPLVHVVLRPYNPAAGSS